MATEPGAEHADDQPAADGEQANSEPIPRGAQAAVCAGWLIGALVLGLFLVALVALFSSNTHFSDPHGVEIPTTSQP